MKKNIKIGIGILILVACVILIVFYFLNRENYNNRKIMQTTIQNGKLNEAFTENQEIDLEDLSVSLDGINYYPEGNEKIFNEPNVLDVTVDFKSKTDKNLVAVMYDYLILDENNHILNTSLWENLTYTKKYITGFLKEKYQENVYYKLNDHCVFDRKTEFENMTDDLTHINKTMACTLKDEMETPNQIQVRIINLKYKFDQEEYKTLENTDLEFVVNIE